jgi:2-polyprenyl-3-methyl-5-hydroxy-6-metoxy-1,4-benzoquinol methylase
MSVDDETRAVYTAEAARYETVIISETERRALDGFLALLRPASHILDIGCGPGLQAVHMQAQGHRVTGWDVTPTFVEAARARGVDAQLGQFADLDETEAFDAVLGQLQPVAHAQGRSIHDISARWPGRCGPAATSISA